MSDTTEGTKPDTAPAETTEPATEATPAETTEGEPAAEPAAAPAE